MKREDIAYYYQPIVSAVTGKIRALEALMHVEMSMLKSPEDVLRLAKEEKRLNGEIKRCEGMLGNERFVSKAPEAKVQEEKDKLAKYQQMLEQVKEQIARIS